MAEDNRSVSAELHELLRRIGVAVAPAAAAALLTFLDELLRWNRRVNLTAIDRRDEALEKHLVDALTLLPLLGEARHLLDMGSGAGVPALPLKIACPALRVTSVDAVAKKISFQRQIIRLLALRDIEARHGRLEDLARDPQLAGQCDLVTARAFAPLADCLRLARPFLCGGGRLLAMKGPEGAEEAGAVGAELARFGYEPCLTTQRLTLPRSGAERLLIVATVRRDSGAG